MSGRSPGFSRRKTAPGSIAEQRRKARPLRVPADGRPSSSDPDGRTHVVRLSILGAEIGLLFGNGSETGSGLLALSSDNDPQHAIDACVGSSLTVEIDARTGLYVLRGGSERDGCILITASEEHLLDHIVADLSCNFMVPGRRQVQHYLKLPPERHQRR
ncbi:hypothetical protein [Ciceribacter sp. RN22]|uniref:hypothetical protein n=1 Tax=Ciceribacter sp. RN22 TaxID=2954932 RepID=UPI002092CB61|nr:hypothetical protein [Ciceribacter sp. RN22]MCO6180911.1 hypothetical protein [Ciceribacter sp. RN22]